MFGLDLLGVHAVMQTNLQQNVAQNAYRNQAMGQSGLCSAQPYVQEPERVATVFKQESKKMDTKELLPDISLALVMFAPLFFKLITTAVFT